MRRTGVFPPMPLLTILVCGRGSQDCTLETPRSTPPSARRRISTYRQPEIFPLCTGTIVRVKGDAAGPSSPRTTGKNRGCPGLPFPR